PFAHRPPHQHRAVNADDLSAPARRRPAVPSRADAIALSVPASVTASTCLHVPVHPAQATIPFSPLGKAPSRLSRLALQLQIIAETSGIELAALERVLERTAAISGMRAVAEAATRRQLLDVREHFAEARVDCADL